MGVQLRTLELGTSLAEDDAEVRSRFRLFSTRVILSNAPTLTHISLDVHFVAGQDSAWDCGIFALCTSLSFLALYHTPQKAFQDYDILTGPGGFPRLAGLHPLIFDGREIKDGFRNLRNLQKLTLSGVPWLLVSGRAVPTFSLQDLLDFERLFPSLQTLELGISGMVSETFLGPGRTFKLSVSPRVSESAKGTTVHRNTVFIVIDLGSRPLLSPLPGRHRPEATTVPGAGSNLFRRRVPAWEMQGRGDAEVEFELVGAMVPPPSSPKRKETPV